MVVIGQFEKGDVGRALEKRFQDGEQADDGDAGQQSGEQTGAHFPEGRPDGRLLDDRDKARESGHRQPSGASRAHDAPAAPRVAADEDRHHGGQESHDEQIHAVSIDHARENGDQKGHEYPGSGVDQDGPISGASAVGAM